MRSKRQAVSVADAALASESGFSLISDEALVKLYASLLRCRVLEQSKRGQVKRGSRGARPAFCEGCAAAAVAVAMDLVLEDTVHSTDNGTIARFLTGVTLDAGLGSLRGVVEPKPDLAARLHTALGAALRNKTKRNGNVAIIFWGDGVLDDWQDALEIAQTHGLPMIFVYHTDLRRKVGMRTERPKTEMVVSYVDGMGLPRITVDGDDVVAVYRVAHEAIGRARLGSGPTLIECQVFRLNGPGKGADPIANMAKHLRGKGLYRRELKKEIVEDFARELDMTMKLARKTARI